MEEPPPLAAAPPPQLQLETLIAGGSPPTSPHHHRLFRHTLSTEEGQRRDSRAQFPHQQQPHGNHRRTTSTAALFENLASSPVTQRLRKSTHNSLKSLSSAAAS